VSAPRRSRRGWRLAAARARVNANASRVLAFRSDLKEPPCVPSERRNPIRRCILGVTGIAAASWKR
jgi:hypothetical protein